MAKPEVRQIRSLPVTSEGDVIEFINRELIPLLRELREGVTSSSTVPNGVNNGDILEWDSTSNSWTIP